MKEVFDRLKLWTARKFGITVKMTDIVYSYSFTFGGSGNQWTAIGEVNYATYWNIHDMDWKVFDTVTFEAFYSPLPGQRYSVWQAKNIHKVNK